MNPALRPSRFLALLVFFAGLRLAAQEFTILPVGDMSRSQFQHSTFAWQVDYRLFATRYIVLSEAYLNEGKVPDIAGTDILRFMFNRIMPAHDIRVNTFEAGMGL